MRITMTDMLTEYRELIALTHQALLDTHSAREWIFTDPHTYAFYKQLAQQSQRVDNPPQPQFNALPGPKAPSQPAWPRQSPPQFAKTTPASNQAAYTRPAATAAALSPSQPLQAAPPHVPTAASPSPIQAPIKVIPAPAQASAQASAKMPPVKEPQPKGPKDSKGGGAIILEPMPPADAPDFSAVKKAVRQLFPQLEIVDAIPDDSAAKNVNTAQKLPIQIPEVLIISSVDKPKHQAFLVNICHALQLCLSVRADVAHIAQIDHAQLWDKLIQTAHLKLIITTDQTLAQHPIMQQLYKESFKDSKRYLGKKPLVLLSDIGLYLKEPKLKASLWSSLCQALA